MKRLIYPALAGFGLMLAMGSSAFADSIFYLTVPENSCTTTNPPCAPADTVQVDVAAAANSNTATVTFTAETVGGSLYALDEVLFEVNAAPGNLGLSYIVTGGSQAGSHSGVTGGSLDLYGTFTEESVDMHDASKVVFTLNLLSGTWADANSVLTPTALPNGNAGHYAEPFDAAAQVRVFDCTSSTQVGCAGNVGDPGDIMDTAGFATPEPSSVILFGSVALLVAGAARRKLTR